MNGKKIKQRLRRADIWLIGIPETEKGREGEKEIIKPMLEVAEQKT